MNIRLVILDLDNTLYDWVGYYIPSFLAMTAELSSLTGISESRLKASFKRVHERHRSTEYAFSIEELDVLQEIDHDLTIAQRLDKYRTAIRAFRKVRRETLRLYSGVRETLELLRSRNVKIAALTDAHMFYAFRRLKQLDVEHLFDAICAPEDHDLPLGANLADVRELEDESHYETVIPLRINVPRSLRKPDPRLVDAVLNCLEVPSRQALLVGDSLSRDILMAQKAGVWDVLAAYGVPDASFYEELKRITYWTDSDVREHELLSKQGAKPSFAINCFADLLPVLEKINSDMPRIPVTVSTCLRADN